jgi:hypothetical protein
MNQSENQLTPGLPASSVIVLPPSLDDQSVQRVLADVAARAADAPLIVNANHCVFATPYALAALLAVGEDRVTKATFIPPSNSDAASYWARARFFRFAEELYDIRGKVPIARWASESDVLLEMTRIPADGTAEAAVQRVQQRVLALLMHAAQTDAAVAAAQAESVADACRNVVNVGAGSAWVIAQVVHYRKQAGRRGVLVGVAGAAGTGSPFAFDGPIAP